MHRHVFRRALTGLLLGLASLAISAQTTLDFESLTPNFYADGDSFTQNGFTMTQSGDFATIDTTESFFLAVAPSGNASQFYAGLNDSALLLTQTSNGLFGLTGFDAGFIEPTFQDEGVSAGRIVVEAIDGNGQSIFGSWDFGLSGADGSFAFLTFNAFDDFTPFASIRSAAFFACVYIGDTCTNPAENLAQFALDNVHVMVPVPEPGTYALLLAGLAGLAYRRRRHGH